MGRGEGDLERVKNILFEIIDVCTTALSRQSLTNQRSAEAVRVELRLNLGGGEPKADCKSRVSDFLRRLFDEQASTCQLPIAVRANKHDVAVTVADCRSGKICSSTNVRLCLTCRLPAVFAEATMAAIPLGSATNCDTLAWKPIMTLLLLLTLLADPGTPAAPPDVELLDFTASYCQPCRQMPSACVPAATMAARLRTVTGGLTSTARLKRFFGDCENPSAIGLPPVCWSCLVA
jgi:hypothetical protein